MNAEKLKRLNNPQRLKDFRFDEILETMNLSGAEKGADIGCGTGLFTAEIAKQLSGGAIYAMDINSEALSMLRDKIGAEAINNVIPVLLCKDPMPETASLDFIFTSAVLHEIDDKENFLSEYKRYLKDGGMIFIVEFMSTKRKIGGDENPARGCISYTDTEMLLNKAGYTQIKTNILNELVYLTSAKNNI